MKPLSQPAGKLLRLIINTRPVVNPGRYFIMGDWERSPDEDLQELLDCGLVERAPQYDNQIIRQPAYQLTELGKKGFLLLRD